jgi:glyoxylase-like metal-dependent hydrolase (beta-lactamase superfamily II)
MEYTEVMHKGDDSGNEMLVRFRLPSGLEIFGLPTKNFYGGDWDLGPTWNYAVLSDKPFLVDAGRFGQGKKLVEMMETIGISAADLEFVLISHGHEDHSIHIPLNLPQATKRIFLPNAGTVPCRRHFTLKIV